VGPLGAVRLVRQTSLALPMVASRPSGAKGQVTEGEAASYTNCFFLLALERNHSHKKN